MRTRHADLSTTTPAFRVAGGEQLSMRLVADLNAACAAAEEAAGSKPLVLYLGGTDTERTESAEVDVHVVNKWERTLRRIERIGAVTVAVAGGTCTGAALEALLCCDHRIAAPDAVFALPVLGATPWPGMALHRLTTQLGIARARQLSLLAPQLPAARAAELGLVDELTDDPDAALEALLTRVGKVAPAELAIRRQLLLDAATTGFDEALGAHLAACDRTLRHERGVTPAEPFPQPQW
ncbi:enoyl-CoA-hydratase DpgB [Streptomyces sp. 8N706]|uniref:enoyl-CoA-hydratase DpgB n=1 Tax=Streptomyces sp. 8N706 TaxID=3457416 RepID=UPI003FD56D75